jgi:type I restriction enzyme, S subunit
MRSNYKRIGKYVRQVKTRNKSLALSEPKGININKVFMPSVANTTGTDLSKYRVVSRYQFAYNPMHVGRDEALPIAMLETEESIIVSPAYVVFEIENANELLPEYLVMWCRRPEFDRNAWFTTDSSVRGGFNWDDLCDMELPVPHIDKQREIVREYSVIVDRIKLNEQLCAKLEETAQALYKHWFVDFEFPISADYAASVSKPYLEGKPFKSSGGEMGYDDSLEKKIPSIWSCGGLHDLANLIDGDRGTNYPSKTEYRANGYCLFLSTSNVTKDGFLFDENNFISRERDELLRKGKLTIGDIVLTTRGSVGNSAYFSDVIEYSQVRINSGMIILRGFNQQKTAAFLFTLLKSSTMAQSIETFLSGSAQQHLPIRDIKTIPLTLPDDETLNKANEALAPLVERNDYIKKEIRFLKKLKDVVLAKISTNQDIAA